MIQTQHLNLIAYQHAHYQAIIQNDLTTLAQLLGIATVTHWWEFPESAQMIAYFEQALLQPPHPFGSYGIVHRTQQQLIGLGGFKGLPNEQGRVEIGYEIFSTHQGHGFATEAAKAWIDFAFQHPQVLEVQAHTLAFENPSVSVLKKAGMCFDGMLHDPDDGDIWRWTIRRVPRVQTVGE